MILTLYLIILSYFVLGGIPYYLVNRKKPKAGQRQSWIKYGVYFLIIHLLFCSIVFDPVYFRYLGVLIVVVGAGEILNLYRSVYPREGLFFGIACVVFVISALAFLGFTGLRQEWLLFTVVLLSVFDAFSQISGQIFGKTKLATHISPNKTVEGMLGGAIVAMGTGLLLRELINVEGAAALGYGFVIVLSALVGDLGASWYKRRMGVKDFSKLLPGHGGFLDRFDSLIMSGALIYLISYMISMYGS